jgi:hypothetical protein
MIRAEIRKEGGAAGRIKPAMLLNATIGIIAGHQVATAEQRRAVKNATEAASNRRAVWRLHAADRSF